MTPQRAADIAVRLCGSPERLGEAWEALLAFDETRFEPTDRACRTWIAVHLRRNAIDEARKAIVRGRSRTHALGEWTIPVDDRGPALVEARDELRAFLDAAMPVTQRLLRAYAVAGGNGSDAARLCGLQSKQALWANLHTERTARCAMHRGRFGRPAPPRPRRAAADAWKWSPLSRVLAHALRQTCRRSGQTVFVADLLPDPAFRLVARDTLRRVVRRSPEFVWLAGDGGNRGQRKAAIRRVAEGAR